MVYVAAMTEFLRVVCAMRATAPGPSAAGHRLSAVLWVPQGKEPVAFDRWSSTFAMQLEEAREADQATLYRMSRCPHVLTWGERVAAVPAAWFAALIGSPRLYQVDDLPWDVDTRQHLKSCAACQEEAYTRLQERATFRWDLLCPGVEALATWLEAESEDPTMVAHVACCGLCQETVQWQATLWVKEGLLPATHVCAKLAAVGLTVLL